MIVPVPYRSSSSPERRPSHRPPPAPHPSSRYSWMSGIPVAGRTRISRMPVLSVDYFY